MIATQSKALAANLKNLWQFSNDTLSFLENHNQGVAHFSLGPQRLCLVNDPLLIESICLKEADNFIKPKLVTEMGDTLFGGALTALDGNAWQQRRKSFAKAFAPNAIHVAVSKALPLVAAYYQAHPLINQFDVEAYYRQLFIELFAELFADIDASDCSRELAGLVETALQAYGDSLQLGFQLPDWVPGSNHRNIAHCMKRVRDIFRHKLQARLQRPLTPNSVVSVLNHLLQTGQIAQADMIDELMVMITVGAHQSALAVAWLYSLLTSHPEYQQMIAIEADKINNDDLSHLDQAADVKLTSACLNEALRLYPPFYMIGRQAVKDCVICDHAFKRGETVIISAWVTQRDPRFFESPLAFKPERWLSGGTMPKFTYFPFGVGTRTCLAQLLLTRLLPVVVGRFLAMFELQSVSAAAVLPKPKATLGFRAPLQLTVEERCLLPTPTIV